MAKLSEKTKERLKQDRKISLDEHCENLIDANLKNAMSILLNLLREMKMKPCWYYSGKYVCKYKKQAVVYIVISKWNCYIRVATVSSLDNTPRNDLDAFVRTLSPEMNKEFISNFKPCGACGHSCAPGIDVEIGGVLHKNVCKENLVYSVRNPSVEQMKWIEKFIHARRNYIDNYAV